MKSPDESYELTACITADKVTCMRNRINVAMHAKKKNKR